MDNSMCSYPTSQNGIHSGIKILSESLNIACVGFSKGLICTQMQESYGLGFHCTDVLIKETL